MDQIEGVEFIQGDITNQITIESLNKYSENRKIKLVICDGAPDITGFTEFDLHIQSQLIYSALNFSIKTLTTNGTFITKMYKGKNTFQILYTLFLFFDKITIAKPKSCRNASFESFIVCEGFIFEKYLDFISKLKVIEDNENIKDFLSYAISKEKMNITDMLFFNNYYKIASIVNKDIPQSLNELGINFVQVGIEYYDSDKTYNLESTGYTEMINPIQMPIDPPYKMYCDKIKGKSSK